MSGKVIRLIPQPTLSEPDKQLKWFFESVMELKPYQYKWYIKFIDETYAGYEELKENRRFYIDKYWEADALLKFTDWLKKQGTQLTSKTRYEIYKRIRKSMDWAYSLGYIDTIIYHAKMFKGVSETKERAAYTEDEDARIERVLASWLTLAISVAQDDYQKSGKGKPFQPKGKREGKIDVDANSSIVVEGVTFPTLGKAAKAYGLDKKTILRRLKTGASAPEAFSLEQRWAKQRGDEGLWTLWMFENIYDCDPKAMLDAVNHKCRNVGSRGTKFHGIGSAYLMKVFKKWGVWPYIDNRLIMPLAAELCRLTGLNVESVRSLTLDSYMESHPLTGQPCLLYEKPRSSSNTRSATRELHLPLLDMEEHYIEDTIQEKVDFLIKLVIKLTSRIRHRAKEGIREKLFIFEDNDWKKDGRSEHIACLFTNKLPDENLHLGMGIPTWTKAFISESGLGDIQFNLSRFRPSLASKMILDGEDVFRIQSVLGHKDVSTTANYLDEQRLQPEFNKVMSESLGIIATSSSVADKEVSEIDYEMGLTMTLMGCGCKNAFAPSEKVRKLTNHKEGSLCKYWNMCLLCDNVVVTENSLPKLIAYKQELSSAINDSPNTMKGRRELYTEIIAKIDGIIEPDEIFPESIVLDATYKANSLDSELLDQLVYQGM